MKIVKVFNNSVIAQDGRLWNVKRVAKCPSLPCVSGNSLGFNNKKNLSSESPYVSEDTVSSRVKTDYRSRFPPKKLSDYDM